nr:hypothetical protein [Desulfobacterales bacterium]
MLKIAKAALEREGIEGAKSITGKAEELSSKYIQRECVRVNYLMLEKMGGERCWVWRLEGINGEEFGVFYGLKSINLWYKEALYGKDLITIVS